jgi:hypothetical protein
MIRVDRPNMGRRAGPKVTAEVLGWSDTHVLINVFVGGKLKTPFLTRPIERFMVEYAL